MITQSKHFNIELKTSGNSIFENLILTVKGYSKNSDNELKLKCNWKRVKFDTTIVINDKSSSYIPTAEDIGYHIEIEAFVQNEPKWESAKAQIGPFLIDENIKNNLEKLIINDSKRFDMFLFNSDTQLLDDRRIEMKIEGNRLKLYQENKVSTDLIEDGDKSENNEFKLIENTLITYNNPKIQLHPYKSKRFYLEFYQYEHQSQSKLNTRINNDNEEIDFTQTSHSHEAQENTKKLNKSSNEPFPKLTEKISSKYHLETDSKLMREIIYILIQYTKMESKVKTNKILQNINNKEPHALTCTFSDLINEIKATQEENSILITSSRIKSREIENLKREMASLEEDFMISLKNITTNISNNDSTSIQEKNILLDTNILFHNLKDQDVNEGKSTKLSTISENPGEGIEYSVHHELKLKFDKLREDFSKISTKEKMLTEKNKELIFTSEVLKNELEEVKQANKLMISKQALTENEFMESLKHKNAFEKNFLDFKNELAYLKEENIQLYKIKEEYERIKYNVPIFTHSNEALNLLEISKRNQEKELNSINFKNKALKLEITNILLENEDLKVTSIKTNEYLERSKDELKIVKGELDELKSRNFELEKEKNIVKENFRNLFSKTYKAIKNDNKDNKDGYFKITVDEYDDFESLRRERDELDAQIMKLKSNGEAKDLLIKSLQIKLSQLEQTKGR